MPWVRHRRTGRLRGILVAGLVFALAVPDPAGAQQSATEFWPELNVFVRLGPESRLYTIVTPTREIEDGMRGDIADVQVGQFWEVGLRPLIPARAEQSRRDSSRFEFLRLRSGIEYQGLPGEKTEARLVEELTPRQVLPGEVLLAWRNRGELRWIDGDFSWRLRTRLWFEREFLTGHKVSLVPYVSAEPFYDSRYDRFSRLRCQFGAAVPLSKRFVPEVNYTYQRDDTGGEELETHALNVVAGFFY